MNDAPALKKANVGIAVAGATAAAKGAADIILTEVRLPSLSCFWISWAGLGWVGAGGAGAQDRCRWPGRCSSQTEASLTSPTHRNDRRRASPPL